MENKKEIFTEILVSMQKKYRGLLEIDKLTAEIADVLARDDRESAQLLLEMRQNEMDSVDETERAIRMLLEAADVGSRIELKTLLNGETKRQPQDFEAAKILELGEAIRRTLKHTIEIDKVVSRKLAGKDSYYEAKD